jgi:hypothetical protein
MKFVCLGYAAEKDWEAMSKSEQDAFIAKCFAYDDELLSGGNWVEGGQALQSAGKTKTLRSKDGKVIVTDGPFAETKEQLGGFGVLEARDMDHAVELMSKHPGVGLGPFEIRLVDEGALKRKGLALRKYGLDDDAAPDAKTETTRFATLGYIGGGACPSEGEFATMIAECAAFDQARQREGHWLSGIGLKGAETAKTLRSKAGQVIVTDGPFAETKEQLGGVVINRFKNMQQAVEVLLWHPALRYGVVIEIRPIDEEMNAQWEARKQQRMSSGASGRRQAAAQG